MLNIQQPDDLISISLHNILSYRMNDKEFINLVTDWNKKIVLYMTPFYPVTIIFEGNEIRFERGELEKADMKIKVDVSTILDMAYGRVDPFNAVGEGKLEMEGLGDSSDLLVKFYNIFMVTMQMVASDPQLNYYEIIENGR
ncbi:MAG: SCP2 sterol-binding domain-containing protein [Candidatus Hodarchaeota archaeon]